MSAFDRVLEVAASSHGFITVAAAEEAGVHPVVLRKLLANGRLERTAQGVYRVPVLAVGRLASFAEAVAWSRDRAAISHESALDLLDLCDVSPPLIHLTVPSGYAPRRRGGDLYRVWRRHCDPADIVEFDGVPVVRAYRSIQDCLTFGTDTRLLLQACESSRHQGHLTVSQVDDLHAQIRQARPAAALGDA